MKYMVTNTIQYTEIVLIEADSEQDARDLAQDSDDFEKNHDEELHDVEVDTLSDSDWNDLHGINN